MKPWRKIAVLVIPILALVSFLALTGTGRSEAGGVNPLVWVGPGGGGAPQYVQFSTVEPNAGIDFVNTSDGYWLAGQAPDLDPLGQLAGGASTPGTQLMYSSDGGATWITAVTDPYGIFGVDFLNGSDGWAPAQDGVWATTDGGSDWTQLSEPGGAIEPIAQVDFTSASNGFAIDGTGQMWTTTTGGSSWSELTSMNDANDLCVDGSTLLLTDQVGNVEESTNSGSSWTSLYSWPGASTGTSDLQSQIACNNSAIEAAFSGGQAGSAQALGAPFDLITSDNSGSSWVSTENTVPDIADALSSTADVALGPATFDPSGDLWDVTYQDGQGSVSIDSYSGAPIMLASSTSIVLNNANIPTTSIYSDLPWQSSPVFSIDFVNNEDGWLTTSLTSDGQGTFASSVYETTNGGSTWSIVYSSAIQNFS